MFGNRQLSICRFMNSFLATVIIVIIIIIILTSITGLFLRSTSLEIATTQASSFRLATLFRIKCNVPSTAVFCIEPTERCFPDMDSKFIFKLFVAIPMAPIITGIIIRLRVAEQRTMKMLEPWKT